MGTNTQKSKIDKCALRTRIEYEDGLLNTRTGIFLVSNSLLGVAAQGKSHSAVNFIMICFAIIICLLWIIVGYKHFCIISQLTKKYLSLSETKKDIVEKIIKTASSIWLPLRPTNILSLWLPWLTLLAWILIIVFSFQDKI